MDNLKEILIEEVAHAIIKGCALSTIQRDGKVYTFINLPSPQTAGTDFQNRAYAYQAATKLVTEKLSQ